MKPFQIKLTRPAEKELLKLSKVVRAKIIESLEVLASNPFAEILQFKKLRGREDLYRIRVGRYRIIYGAATAAGRTGIDC